MRKPITDRSITDLQFVLLLGALSMIGPFAIDTLFPAFPVAGLALGVSQAMMQQTISSYLFAFAIGSLLHGPLSDSFGRRPIVLLCMLVCDAFFDAARISCGAGFLRGWRNRYFPRLGA